MTCGYIYLELGNMCKNFLNSVEILYYTASNFKDFESCYYTNLKRFMNIFVKNLEIDSKRYKRCIDLNGLIEKIKRYLDHDPDLSLLYIYDFCSKFE